MRKEKWLLEMESTPGEYAVKILLKLEYYINLVTKAAAGFESIDSYFKRSSVGKMSLHEKKKKRLLHAAEKSFVKGTKIQQTALLLCLQKLPQLLQTSAATP